MVALLHLLKWRAAALKESVDQKEDHERPDPEDDIGTDTDTDLYFIYL